MKLKNYLTESYPTSNDASIYIKIDGIRLSIKRKIR